MIPMDVGPLASGIFAVTEALSLTIWCPEAYRPAVEQCLAVFGDRIVPDYHTLDGAGALADLTAAANAPALMIYDDLADVLARRMAPVREDPDHIAPVQTLPEAVTRWTTDGQALLAAFRKARRHITLLPARALITHPAQSRAALAQRYDLPLPNEGSEAVTEPVLPFAGQSPHVVLMANAVLMSAPEAAAARDRLEAVSLPVDGYSAAASAGPEVMSDLLAQVMTFQLGEREAVERAHRLEVRRLEAQTEEITHQLRVQADTADMRLLEREAASVRMVEQAAQHEAATTILQDELVRCKAQLAGHDEELSVLRAAHQQLESTRAALHGKVQTQERDIAAMAREIATRDERIRGMAAGMMRHEEEALTLRNEVAALRRSTSWKITGPLRRVIRLTRRIFRR